MAARTLVLSAPLPPLSDTVFSRPLPKGTKTILSAQMYGSALGGPLTANVWLSTKAAGSPIFDPQGLNLFPANWNERTRLQAFDAPFPLCLPVPQGYETVYEAVCNPLGIVQTATTVLQVDV